MTEAAARIIELTRAKWAQEAEANMSDFLSAAELAELVGCKANQRHAMAKWLDSHRWRYVLDKNGLPKVARAYYNKKLGIEETKEKARYDSTPNLQAFA